MSSYRQLAFRSQLPLIPRRDTGAFENSTKGGFVFAGTGIKPAHPEHSNDTVTEATAPIRIPTLLVIIDRGDAKVTQNFDDPERFWGWLATAAVRATAGMPTLFQRTSREIPLSDNPCRVNRSMQHHLV
jgi:hypothetical protein